MPSELTTGGLILTLVGHHYQPSVVQWRKLTAAQFDQNFLIYEYTVMLQSRMIHSFINVKLWISLILTRMKSERSEWTGKRCGKYSTRKHSNKQQQNKLFSYGPPWTWRWTSLRSVSAEGVEVGSLCPTVTFYLQVAVMTDWTRIETPLSSTLCAMCIRRCTQITLKYSAHSWTQLAASSHTNPIQQLQVIKLNRLHHYVQLSTVKSTVLYLICQKCPFYIKSLLRQRRQEIMFNIELRSVTFITTKVYSQVNSVNTQHESLVVQWRYDLCV